MGARGYLKVSLHVLGPGDEVPVSRPSSSWHVGSMEKEEIFFTQAGGDVGEGGHLLLCPSRREM